MSGHLPPDQFYAQDAERWMAAVLDQRAFRDGAEEAQVEIDKRERRRREVAAAQAEANERHRERRGR